MLIYKMNYCLQMAWVERLYDKYFQEQKIILLYFFLSFNKSNLKNCFLSIDKY